MISCVANLSFICYNNCKKNPDQLPIPDTPHQQHASGSSLPAPDAGREDPLPATGSRLELDWDKLKEESHPEDNFSIEAFFKSCSWGWLVVGSLAFFLSAFFVIPLPTVQLAEYVENTTQILIVVLAFLITYKVFTVEATDVQKFMRSFRHATKDGADAPNLADDDAEAAGAKAGRLVETLMKKFKDSNASISIRRFPHKLPGRRFPRKVRFPHKTGDSLTIKLPGRRFPHKLPGRHKLQGRNLTVFF